MPREKLVRRARSATPFLATPMFGALPGFEDVDDLVTRMHDMMRMSVAGMPEPLTAEQFPALNLAETKSAYVLTAELPGMTAKDVAVDYCDGVLTIKGEKEHQETKDDDGKKYFIWERRFGAFQRSLPFPGGIDEEKIVAEFKDGILTVRLPKAEEAKAKRRAIGVNAT